MAEHVQQNLERMVPELEELERLGIFSRDEIRNIIRKRRDFEYVLHRKGAKKTDYLRYMQYELNLDMLRKKRKSRLRIRGRLRGEYAGITRIHSIFQIALHKFMGDVKLWIQYIDFCKRVHSTMALGKTLARALQFHSEKPSLWIMAAKWEFEDNNNVPNCRALFQRGLRVNSSSKQLWLEYFRMELLHLEKIKKRRAVLGLKEGEKQQISTTENDDEEVAPEFLSGKVPEIVFKKAIECIPDDVQFRKSFIDIYRLFEDTKEGCDLIYNSLLEDFPLSEEAWNLLARRHLEESISDASKKSGVITDVQWSELESEMNKLFQDAVKKVPTAKMWQLYIETFVDLLGNSSEQQIKRREKIVLEIFSQASRNNMLTENLYKLWVSALLQASKKKQALAACKKALEEFNSSVSLWSEHLNLKILSRVKKETIHNEFSTALNSVDPKESLPLWNQWIDWCIEKNPDQVKAVFERSLESHIDFAPVMKERYVEWTAETKGIKKARALYKRLTRTPPVGLSLFHKCIELELSQEEPSSKRVRGLYEAAVDRFGASHPDLWLDYIRFELKDSSDNPGAPGLLYWRATKCLDGEHTETFVGLHSLLQAGRV